MVKWEAESRIRTAVEQIKTLDEEERVQFIILFGSSAVGNRNVMSDIDLAVGYQGDQEERFDFRLNVSGELPDDFDVQIFQDLPLYLRKEVLKGEILFTRDFRKLHNIALETIRDYDLFEQNFLDYIQR